MKSIIYGRDAIEKYVFMFRVNFTEEITLEIIEECFKNGYYGDIKTVN